jgi:hypothetical protein
MTTPTVADLESAFISIRVRISHTIVSNQDLGFKLIDRLIRARRAAKAGRTQEAYAILTGEMK